MIAVAIVVLLRGGSAPRAECAAFDVDSGGERAAEDWAEASAAAASSAASRDDIVFLPGPPPMRMYARARPTGDTPGGHDDAVCIGVWTDPAARPTWSITRRPKLASTRPLPGSSPRLISTVCVAGPRGTGLDGPFHSFCV